MKVTIVLYGFPIISKDPTVPAKPSQAQVKVFTDKEKATRWIGQKLEAWLNKHRDYAILMIPKMRTMFQLMGDDNFDYTLLYLMYRLELVTANQANKNVLAAMPFVDMREDIEVDGAEPTPIKKKTNRHDMLEIE